MERVAVVDFELAGVEGFDLGIERAHAGNPWKKRRPSLAVGPACAFHDCLWETRLPAPAQRHAIALLEVALGGHVGEARGLEQRAPRRALLPAVLDPQPAATTQVRGRVGCDRSEERRVGQECVSTGRSRVSRYLSNKKNNN